MPYETTPKKSTTVTSSTDQVLKTFKATPEQLEIEKQLDEQERKSKVKRDELQNAFLAETKDDRKALEDLDAKLMALKKKYQDQMDEFGKQEKKHHDAFFNPTAQAFGFIDLQAMSDAGFIALYDDEKKEFTLRKKEGMEQKDLLRKLLLSLGL